MIDTVRLLHSRPKVEYVLISHYKGQNVVNLYKHDHQVLATALHEQARVGHSLSKPKPQ